MSLIGRAKTALEVTSTIVLTVASGALAWNLLRSPEPTPSASARRAKVEEVSGLRIEATRATNRMGNGAVAIVEFSDFECPFCGQHMRDTYPSIQRDLIEPGKATYVSLAFPLERIHPHARKASEAAECAARQGRYWEMHERLFASETALAAQGLSDSARAIGLDLKRFDACLVGEASDKVAADIAEGRRLGVNSTPTFFVGTLGLDGAIDLVRRINGAAPFEDFLTTIADVSGTSASRVGTSR